MIDWSVLGLIVSELQVVAILWRLLEISVVILYSVLLNWLLIRLVWKLRREWLRSLLETLLLLRWKVWLMRYELLLRFLNATKRCLTLKPCVLNLVVLQVLRLKIEWKILLQLLISQYFLVP